MPQARDRSPELSAEGLSLLGPRNDCDREPIHRSAAIQPHGFVLVAHPDTLEVVAASENVGRHLRLRSTPTAGGDDELNRVLGANLRHVLGARALDQVAWSSLSSNPHESLAVRIPVAPEPPVRVVEPGTRIGAHQPEHEYDMVAHLTGDLLMLEFEPTSSDTTYVSAAFYQRQRSAMQKLGAVDDVEQICRLAAHEVRGLTGYDAVRIYKFEPDAHGHVIAEACAPGIESYLGLHYPAGDIPRQARLLYLRNWIRVIGDVDYVPVPIRTLESVLLPDELDLSMSVLRSVSSVHLQYMRNMGLAASMSVSIVVDNQLWGLISCHHTSPRRLTHVERLACEAIGQLVSVRILSAEAVAMYEEATSLGRKATQVFTAMVAGETPAQGAVTAGDSLLGMVGADGAVIDLDGQRLTVGVVPDPQTVDWLVTRLAQLASGAPATFATDSLSRLWPQDPSAEHQLPADLPCAGALYLPLSGRAHGFVLWLRRERAEIVRWAGQTGDKDDGQEAQPLTPRTSFAEWLQEQRGRSAPWRPAEITAATQLMEALPDVLLHRAQSRLMRFALHDPLTGLPNRRLLTDRLDQLVSTLALSEPANDPDAPPPGRSPSAGLLFVELEGSPRAGFGPAGSDELFALIIERLRALVDRSDTVARMGGDEFVILLARADEGEACALGERIVEELRRPFVLEGRRTHWLTVNVGVAIVTPGIEATEALRQADAALYHARRTGPNQVAMYDEAAGTAISPELHLGNQLRTALATGQLALSYQPILPLTDSGASGWPESGWPGFEASYRWEHPTMGTLTQDRLLRTAEKAGVSHELARVAVDQTTRQLQLSADPELTIAVRIPVHDLCRTDFVARIVAKLTAAGIDPQRLCIEISEAELLEQPDVAIATLRQLQAAGLRIAVDEFGTSFASLAALRELPNVVLRISAGLVAGLSDVRDAAMVASIVQFAHALDWHIVADGVANAQQLAAVREFGIDFAQGDLFGPARPRPAYPLSSTS